MKNIWISSIFILASTFNYWLLLIAATFLFTELTTDVDSYMKENHIYPGVGLLGVMGIGIGPILSIVLSVISYYWLNKLSIRKKSIIIGIQISLSIISLIWLAVS
ncbi:hypothetical protein ACFSO7_09010 [Bacillus sp. CGMCC 1.16607]|uniref:hypothetical protein n=1 Tax=Bacillus sp. CGMCC 1.16607 TaxID=3351842 RepID=UPI003630C6BD